MSSTIADLTAVITSLGGKIGTLETKITDFATDFHAAIAVLQAQIAAGGNLDAAVAALVTLDQSVGGIADSLTALDTEAETISGKPTP